MRQRRQSEGNLQMKTYEIKMNRSRWYSLIIGILCVAMIVVMLTPYFTYGKKTSEFVPVEGNQKMLFGKSWILNGYETSEVKINGTSYTIYPEGYRALDIDDKGKATLSTSNVLRNNQVSALNAFVVCVDNYNEIAQAYEDSLSVQKEAADIYEEALRVHDEIVGKFEADKGLDKKVVGSFDITEIETKSEGDDTEEQADLKNVKQWLKNCSRRMDQINAYVAAGEAQLAVAEKAVMDAYEAVVTAYGLDVELPWIKEDTAKYNEFYKNAYIAEYNEAYVSVANDDFKQFLANKYPEEYAAYAGADKAMDRLYSAVTDSKNGYDIAALKKEFLLTDNGAVYNEETADADIAALVLPEAKIGTVSNQFVKAEFNKLDSKDDAYKQAFVDASLQAFKDFMAKKYPVEYKAFLDSNNAADNLYTFVVANLKDKELISLYEKFFAEIPAADGKETADIINAYLSGSKKELKFTLNAANENVEVKDENPDATAEDTDEAPEVEAAEEYKTMVSTVFSYTDAVAVLDARLASGIMDSDSYAAAKANLDDNLNAYAEGIKKDNPTGYYAAYVSLHLDAFKEFLVKEYPDDFAALSASDLKANNNAKAKDNFYTYKFTPIYNKNDLKSRNKYFDEYIKATTLSTDEMISVIKTMKGDVDWINADSKVDTEALKNGNSFDKYVDAYMKAYTAAFKAFLRDKLPEDFAKAGREFKDQKKAYENFTKAKLKKLSASEKNEVYAEFVESNGALSAGDEGKVLTKMTEILAGKMSDEDRDVKTYGVLDAQIKDSDNAAKLAKDALKSSNAALKEAGKSQTSDKAVKDRDFISKQIVSMNGVQEKYAEIYDMEVADFKADGDYKVEKGKRFDIKKDFELNAYDLEKEASKEDMLLKTDATIKYNAKSGAVTVTYANGDVKETSYATDLSYDSIKHLSILAYVAFPTDYAEFESDIAHYIQGYFINDVVLVPIVMFIFSLVGIVFAILKKDSFASGVCPTIVGLVGTIAYLTSRFLKLGDHRILHLCFCIALLIVGGLQLYFGIRERIAEKKKIDEIVI